MAKLTKAVLLVSVGVILFCLAYHYHQVSVGYKGFKDFNDWATWHVV